MPDRTSKKKGSGKKSRNRRWDAGDPAADESFGKRKDRRRPVGRRRVSDLEADPEARARFDEPGLETLHALGALEEIDAQIKSGKEATVYRARGPGGRLLAAKVYRDEAARAYKDEELYRRGRFLPNARVRKAIDRARRTGLDPDLALWVHHEYRMLWRLHGAGVPVPVPAVGPDGLEMVKAGRVMLASWIGARGPEDPEPAPRVADADLDAEAASLAWKASLALLGRLLGLGLVHGDYSAWNLLRTAPAGPDGDAPADPDDPVAAAGLVLIDVPQMVGLERNPAAADLLARDVRGLCASFRRFGIDEDPAVVLAEVRARAGFPPSGPLSR